MVELASAAGYVEPPHSFVSGTVRPHLYTVTVSEAILDLALIYSTIRKNQLVFEFKTLLLRQFIYELSN